MWRLPQGDLPYADLTLTCGVQRAHRRVLGEPDTVIIVSVCAYTVISAAGGIAPARRAGGFGPMIRTQIQLTEEQSSRLHEVSRRAGVSRAEIIRRSIDRYLDASPECGLKPPDRLHALQVVGRFHSGLGDVASRHDEYLDEAYAPPSPSPTSPEELL